MKNKFFIFNLIMICSFSLFVVLNLFTSNGEFSQLENRVLQEAPEFSIKKIVDRTYMDETENYSNDQLLFREFFVKAKAFTSFSYSSRVKSAGNFGGRPLKSAGALGPEWLIWMTSFAPWAWTASTVRRRMSQERSNIPESISAHSSAWPSSAR